MYNLLEICQLTEWDKWTAIGTVGLAILTFVLAIIALKTISQQRRQLKILRDDENDRAFKTNSLTAIIDFDQQFGELFEERKKIAQTILKKEVLDKPLFDYNDVPIEIEDLYDFFDTLGFLVNQSYIKADIAHQYFYHWFSQYYKFYRKYNIREKAGYPESVWCNMENLLSKLKPIEDKLHGAKTEEITTEELKDFFREESGGKSKKLRGSQ